MDRGTWSSKAGFILAAAGSAVGLGAVWKFPYMVGMNGGGIFLLLYLACVLLVGLTVMLAELGLGRLTRSDAVGAFRSAGGGAWTAFGYLGVLAAFTILAFYTVVGGWTVGYLGMSLTGDLAQGDAGLFSRFSADPSMNLVCVAVFMLICVGVIAGGVKQGIERVSKVLMPLLLILVLCMIARSVTLPGAEAGLRFFLVPDVSKISGSSILEALGFACFSLSLGFGAMIAYGSYLPSGQPLMNSALWVIGLQTLACILAGLMVLPAVFAMGMAPEAGPGLTYSVLPAVFARMQGGMVFAALFFLLLLIAALTSCVSILEAIVAFLIDQHGFTRMKACLLTGASGYLAAIPALLSFGPYNLFTLDGKNPFALLDGVSSNLMLPISVLATCMLMGWKAYPAFRQELLAGSANSRPSWLAAIRFGVRYLAPGLIATVMLAGLLR